MVTGEINKGKKRIVLCGHSMGGIWAQQIASYLGLNDMPRQNVFVVGSGVPKWCNYDISNFYKNRWIFFASCENGVIDQLVGTTVPRETFPMSKLAYERNYINKIYSQYEDPSGHREMGTYLLQANKLFYPPPDGRSILFHITFIKKNEKLEKSSELYSYNNSLHDFKFYRSQIYSLLNY
jgi:pimeloyl-ACP methyl ester carboxylesterase